MPVNNLYDLCAVCFIRIAAICLGHCVGEAIAAICSGRCIFLILRLHQLISMEFSFSSLVTSTDLHLKFACVTSSVLLLGQLRDLPNTQK